MFLKRYFVPGLAHASYLFGADGEAAVVDPKRDVDDYINDAQRAGLRVTAILNSHPHADFTSGFLELGARTGAKIYASHQAPATYERVAAHDADRLKIGSLEIEMLETPGHSPDSLSFLVREGGRPVVVFTGDLLFVSDVGRPDLRDADADPTALANQLYDSLFHKLLTLPGDVMVYPSHGAGSLCGRAPGAEPFTTIERERLFNWAAQIRDRGEFVKEMTANLPDRPAYFAFDVAINLRGAPPLNQLLELRSLTEEALKTAAREGAMVIDTRASPMFGAGHFPGSLNIGVDSALFSTWVGFFVPGGPPIALVVGSVAAAARAQLELARIGFDNVVGYFDADELQEIRQLSQMTVHDLKSAQRREDGLQILDVRARREWDNGHIDGARNLPLSQLAGQVNRLSRNAPLAVICGGGYRSSIAASWLMSQGFTNVQNVMGGMAAFTGTKWSDAELADAYAGTLDWSL